LNRELEDAIAVILDCKKNEIILLTKFYIFRTKVNEGMVNFEALKN